MSQVAALNSVEEIRIHRVVFNGMISGNSSFRLKYELETILASAKDVEALILDLRLVTYIDSSGVSFCIAIFCQCNQNKITLTIEVGREIAKIFKILNLDKVIPIVEVL